MAVKFVPKSAPASAAPKPEPQKPQVLLAKAEATYGIDPAPPAPGKKMSVEQVEGVGHVEVTSPKGKIDETLKFPVQGPGPFANVGVTMGYTKNLGNFESLKIQVSLHMPCASTQSSVEIAYSLCKDWVDQKITKVKEEVEAAMSGQEPS